MIIFGLKNGLYDQTKMETTREHSKRKGQWNEMAVADIVYTTNSSVEDERQAEWGGGEGGLRGLGAGNCEDGEMMG